MYDIISENHYYIYGMGTMRQECQIASFALSKSSVLGQFLDDKRFCAIGIVTFFDFFPTFSVHPQLARYARQLSASNRHIPPQPSACSILEERGVLLKRAVRNPDSG